MHACMYVLYTSYIYHVYKVYTWHWFDHFANLLKKLHRKYSMNFKKTFKTVVLLGTCDKLLLKNDFTLKLVLKIQQSSLSHIWHQITRSGNFICHSLIRLYITNHWIFPIKILGILCGILCRANQWTGFYMIMASVMKELKYYTKLEKTLTHRTK